MVKFTFINDTKLNKDKNKNAKIGKQMSILIASQFIQCSTAHTKLSLGNHD